MKRLDLLKCVSSVSWGADRAVMLRLYRAIVRTKLDYCSIVYMSAKDTALKVLDPVHHAAIRLSTGAFRSSPVESLNVESGEMPLVYRRSQLQIQYYLQTLNNTESPSAELVPGLLLGERQHLLEQDLHPISTAAYIARYLRECDLGDLTLIRFQLSLHGTWGIDVATFCSGFASPLMKQTCASLEKLLLLTQMDPSRTYLWAALFPVLQARSTSQKLHPFSSFFTAELQAIYDALHIIDLSHHRSFVIFTDSKSATQKLQDYNTTHPLAYKIIHKLLHLRDRNKFVVVCWRPSHVGIKGKYDAADKAARAKALSNDLCDECPVFYKDYFPIIRCRRLDLWAEKWRDLNNNKFRTIRYNTHPWPSSSQYGRKTSIILTRLRIGHTLLTHGFLMDQSHPPYCNDCLVLLTVMHFVA